MKTGSIAGDEHSSTGAPMSLGSNCRRRCCKQQQQQQRRRCPYNVEPRSVDSTTGRSDHASWVLPKQFRLRQPPLWPPPKAKSFASVHSESKDCCRFRLGCCRRYFHCHLGSVDEFEVEQSVVPRIVRKEKREMNMKCIRKNNRKMKV